MSAEIDRLVRGFDTVWNCYETFRRWKRLDSFLRQGKLASRVPPDLHRTFLGRKTSDILMSLVKLSRWRTQLLLTKMCLVCLHGSTEIFWACPVFIDRTTWVYSNFTVRLYCSNNGYLTKMCYVRQMCGNDNCLV